ncbi:hypothetical protein CFC21_012347 [Triticum aestivum]|nr:hypothetical protein CFC21_012347 [Triticum aestivum]
MTKPKEEAAAHH